MFNFFGPVVKEFGDYITVSYVSRGNIQKDIQKIFNTSRINTYMFKTASGNYFRFQKFFALEFYYIIDSILNTPTAKYLSTARRQLVAIQAGLMENTWLKSLNDNYPSRLDYGKLKNMHFTPLDYQLNFIKRYDWTLPRYNLRGMLLAAGVGTGKTNTSLSLAECLEADRIIIFCPKPTVSRVWVKSATGIPETGCVYKRPQSCWSKESDLPYRGERIAIFHYEAIPTALEMVQQLQGKKTVIILDESHNLNEIVSLRTQRFIDFCNLIKSNDILLMTGTPVKALGVEIIPMLKTIDPLFNDETLAAFKKMYAGSVQATTAILTRRYNIISYKVSTSVIKLTEPVHENINVSIKDGINYTLEAIATDMLQYSTKRVKELTEELPKAEEVFEHCFQLVEGILSDPKLPKKDIIANRANLAKYLANIRIIKNHYKSGSLYLIPEEMKFCTNFEKTVILPNLPNKELKEAFKHSKTIVKYLKLKVRGECLGRILGRRRIDAFTAIVEGIPFEDIIESTEKKTVVFTSFAEVIEAALAKLKRLRYNPIAVYGQFTKSLSSIIDQFEQQVNINPLVATYASLSTGVPLIVADTMVVINPPYRQYIMDQTIARIHRLGQTSQTRIFNITLDTGELPNISTRTIDILKWSKEQVNAIIGVDDTYDEEEEQDVALEAFSVALEELAIPEYINLTEQTKRNILTEW